MPLTTALDAFSRVLPSSTEPTRVASPRKRNVLLRVVDAIAGSNQRKAEREIARYLARQGGVLTDRLERDIVQRFGSTR